MKFDTKTAADYAKLKLDSLLERATRDSAEIAATNDIPTSVAYFAELREQVKLIAAKVAALQKHVDQWSYETLPTMMDNQEVKSIRVEKVGLVSIVARWTASMLNKEKALDWLRNSGNGGIIIETVPAPTLGAFAKEQAMEGHPLPDDVFKVSAAPYVSIRQ